MNNRDDILITLRDILVEMFEVEPEQVTLDARLYQDLDIDSIDAVDLVVKLKEITGKKLAADDFQHVRTVDDVVAAVEQLLAD